MASPSITVIQNQITQIFKLTNARGHCPLLRNGDKEGKEVLKLGNWEDGKEGKKGVRRLS